MTPQSCPAQGYRTSLPQTLLPLPGAQTMGGPRRSAFFILQGENLGALLGGVREPLAAPLGNSDPPLPHREMVGSAASSGAQLRGSHMSGRHCRHMERVASSARAPPHPGRNPQVL